MHGQGVFSVGGVKNNAFYSLFFNIFKKKRNFEEENYLTSPHPSLPPRLGRRR